MNKEKILNEVKEIRKIIDQPEKISAEAHLKDILSKCIGKVTDGRITWYLYDQWVFHQDFKNSILWCYYYEVWEIFEKEYELNYEQIQDLHKNVVGKALNCKGFTPMIMF